MSDPMSEMSIEDKIDLVKRADPDELDVWADDPDEQVKAVVANREDCPKELLGKLSLYGYGSHTVGVALSTNLSLSVDELTQLSSNLPLHCSSEVLREFSKNEDSEVRASVALSSNCPEDVLRELSQDKCESVRIAVGSNLNCPEDVLGVLINDDEKSVAKAVLYRNKVPISVIKIGLQGNNKDLILKWLKNKSKRLPIVKNILDEIGR